MPLLIDACLTTLLLSSCLLVVLLCAGQVLVGARRKTRFDIFQPAKAMTETTQDAIHLKWMQLALDEARKSQYVPTAFCVGACIVQPSTSQVLSTGYSRELPQADEGEFHAEHCAIVKLQQRLGSEEASKALKGAAIYTTMEPCSVRKSGNRPCADRIIEAGMAEVYLGIQEPGDFVVCEGVDKLEKAGIKVVAVQGLEKECLSVARGQGNT